MMKPAAMTSGVYASVACAILTLALLALGCANETCTGTTGSGYVNVTVSVEDWAMGAHGVLTSGPVDLEDIESLLLTIERITLNVSSEDDLLEGVVVFDATEHPTVDNEVDLVDLSGLSEIVSAAPVPGGEYKQVRLEISDPRLRLVGDPDEEYRTNVQRTANGRLFAGVDLTIQAGETLDLNLILNDLHLVEKGNGDFVLTPQLRVEIASLR